ncbi:YqcI/YcgG family protein [Lysinibacillus sp. NPDC093197]|uniref:YqcI/YcgG family protein n=1 Tax=Lysinibacillus sp. NPDC093197 TaxID=3364132 RepID=UPI00381EAD7D
MGVVFEKNWLDQHLPSLPLWQQDAFKDFSLMIADEANTFPCIPARTGFLSNQLRFSFIGDPRELQSAKALATCLKEYGYCARSAGKYTSHAIFFETPKDMLENYEVEDYRALFWTLLNNVTAFDEKEWPREIPSDPSVHTWEFCFDGEPYFVFCATPAHQLRKSRHFSTLLMAFQPRWVFEDINDTTVLGQKLKRLIRKRIDLYDAIPGHPDLKWYGQKDNYEWKQYFLSDDEGHSPSTCPFLRGNLQLTFPKERNN